MAWLREMAIPFLLMHPRQEAMNYTFEELLPGGTVGRKLSGGSLASSLALRVFLERRS